MDRGGNQGDRLMKKYAVFIHGVGDGMVWARNNRAVRWIVLQHLANQGVSMPFTQPMQISRLWGARGYMRHSVCKWQMWNEDEPQEIEAKFSLVGGV